MSLHKKLYRRFNFYARASARMRKITLPGFGGIPVYFVIKFFINQLMNEIITVRASAIAFNFFLALIPALIFLFSMLPYVPVQDLDQEIFELLAEFMPVSAFETIQSTLQDILVKKRSGLLSFGIILTLYFATNGIFSIMEAFHKDDTRSYLMKRFVSLLLFIVLSVLLLLGITIFIVGEVILDYLLSAGFFENLSTYYFLQLFQGLLFALIIFVGISILYYYGTHKHGRWKFLSPGSLMATLLCMLTSYIFAFYVDNFSQYNKFYGSLGALIALMLWFYFNSLVLIIGFELNQSIILARASR